MKDQAELLRRLAAARSAQPAPSAASAGPEAHVIGSGKGGVGKSVLAVLLAAELARRGRRVLLFDGSQNQGNLHILIGARPKIPLSAVLAGEAEPQDLLMPVEAGLWLLPADSGAEAVHLLSSVDKARLHHRLSSLYSGFDDVVVDAGPGIDGVVRAASMRAARLVAVAAPEPASLSDVYALIKILHLQVPFVAVEVLVNRAETEAEGAAAFELLALAARRFLDRELGSLGTVLESPEIKRAVRAPGELLSTRDATVARVAENWLEAAAVPARVARS